MIKLSGTVSVTGEKFKSTLAYNVIFKLDCSQELIVASEIGVIGGLKYQIKPVLKEKKGFAKRCCCIKKGRISYKLALDKN